MAGPGLPVNVDTTYADDINDASVKLHQQHHDAVHAIVNQFDTSTPTVNTVPVHNGTVFVYSDPATVPATLVAQTATYTAVASDMGRVITFNAASGVTYTLNTGIGSIGQTVTIVQLGAGAVTVGGTATVNSRGGSKVTGGQYAMVSLLCVAANTWILTGDLV